MKTEIEKIFDDFEFCIIKPYEGTLQNKNKCCVELHSKMTGDLRNWFNKLKMRYKND